MDVVSSSNLTVGGKIKQYMLSKGISQSFISSKTGIQVGVLNAILNSKRKLYAEEYFAICEVLDVQLAMFKAEVIPNNRAG